MKHPTQLIAMCVAIICAQNAFAQNTAQKYLYKKYIPALKTSSDSSNTGLLSWDLSTNELNFGDVAQGQSKTLTVNLLNTGNLVIASPSVDTIGDGLTAEHNCLSVGAGQICSINVTAQGFATTTPLSGSLTVASGGISKAVNIVGSYSFYDFQLSPSSLDFGSIFITETGTKTFSITNLGTNSIVVPTLSSTNPKFKLNHSCGTLAPAQACSVTVNVDDLDVGTDTGSSTVAMGGISKIINFKAKYVSASSTLAPDSTSSANFGFVDLNQVKTQTFIFTNTSELTVNNLSVTKPAATTFASNTCTGTLNAGSSCTVQLSWQPTSYSDLGGSLMVISSETQKSITLSGKVNQSTATLQSGSLNLGSISQYSAQSATITFKNDGVSKMNISSLSGLPAELSITSNTCANIAAGATCSITLSLNTDNSVSRSSVSVTPVGPTNSSPILASYTIAPTSASCSALKSLNPTLPSGTYSIDPDGAGGNAPISAYCDMVTDGGGWTRVSSIDSGSSLVSGMMSTVAISDSNLSYSNVLLVAKSNMAIHYETTSDVAITPGWSSIGINPAIHGLKFGTSWYFLATVNTWRGYGSANTSPNYSLNLSGSVAWANSNYTTVTANTATGAGSCDLNKQASQTFCGKAIKVAVPSGLRLTGFNDLESLSQSVTGNTTHAANNRQIRALDIFVK